MPPCIQRNQTEMHKEISHTHYFVTRHSEYIYIYIYIPPEGMAPKAFSLMQAMRANMYCKRIGSQMLKLCKSTEGSQVAMPFQCT